MLVEVLAVIAMSLIKHRALWSATSRKTNKENSLQMISLCLVVHVIVAVFLLFFIFVVVAPARGTETVEPIVQVDLSPRFGHLLISKDTQKEATCHLRMF